jgi:hypothetical protein
VILAFVIIIISLNIGAGIYHLWCICFYQYLILLNLQRYDDNGSDFKEINFILLLAMYLIWIYVKFKPALLTKIVTGTPASWYWNFLFSDKFMLSCHRWVQVLWLVSSHRWFVPWIWIWSRYYQLSKLQCGITWGLFR